MKVNHHINDHCKFEESKFIKSKNNGTDECTCQSERKLLIHKKDSIL